MSAEETFREDIRWAPFGALVLCIIIAVGFWKIEKSRMPVLKPYDRATAPAAPRPEPVMQGKVAPDFTLPLVGGGQITLSDFKGKKMVFLNVWATWCTPCREEMPSMQRLYNAMAGHNFEMIAISVDKDEDEVPAFIKEFGLTFPIPMDPAQKYVKEYQITGLPETFIITADGMVKHHIIGPNEWDSPGIIQAFQSASAKIGQPQTGQPSSGMQSGVPPATGVKPPNHP